MLNKAFLMGRLTADPELRHTQSGNAVASFRLAVDRDFKDQTTGERKTDFFPVVAWRSTAEFVSRYFAKGKMAVVEGRLQVREYTDRDNNRRFATEIVADNVYFGESKKEGDAARQPAGGYQQYGGYPQGPYSAPPPPQGYGGYPSTGGYGQPQGGSPAPPPGPYSPRPQTGGAYPAAPAPDQFADLPDYDDGELPF